MGVERLALGTAQFGFSYGVANQFGQVSRDEASAIIDCAKEAGLDSLDTAVVYGESEQRLGEIGVESWQVISKLPAMPEGHTDVATWVQKLVLESLARLRIPKLHGLLLHRPQQLLDLKGEELYKALIDLKVQGKIEKIGISIYDPDELDVLLPNFHFDLVQAPFNIIDRRLETSGWLTRLQKSGVEVHARSVFLQGLLLMKHSSRPEFFSQWQFLWDQWRDWLVDQSMTPVQACLGFAMLQPEISRVVVGVDSLKQLKDILASVEISRVMPPIRLASEDINLINPSYWGKY
jgi:aryl-alcohol dehydrogenase-like predicted oxidoreductase